MSDSIGAQERLLNLVAFLLKQRALVDRGTILSKVDGYGEAPTDTARERTFERDKRRLEDLGFIIRFEQDSFGREGYRLDTERTLLPPLALKADERLVLEALAQTYLGEPGTEGEFARNLRSALFKIRFDTFDAEPVEGKQPYSVSGVATREAERERAALDVLLDAVTTRRTVRFHYESPVGSSQTRTVDPWGLAYVRGAWYLAGYSHERGDERLFKVMRITDRPVRLHPTGRGGDYEIPADYRVANTV